MLRAASQFHTTLQHLTRYIDHCLVDKSTVNYANFMASRTGSLLNCFTTSKPKLHLHLLRRDSGFKCAKK
jgi:hypothetical protein